MTKKEALPTKLKVGDPVMVIAGGNPNKGRNLKGRVGKVKKINSETGRVWVEGLNMIKRHKRALSANDSSGIIEREGSVHISNVMFYAESVKSPVRLCHGYLGDGRKVRGFRHPETNKFEQIEV